MKWIIDRIIEFSVRNRFLVIPVVVGIAGWGVWAFYHTPVDAIPDLSENQVIVFADWPGRSPKEVEDQVTYPLSVNLQGLAKVKAVRGGSDFGFSMINIIFEDGVDFYFARQRVLERLSTAASILPAGVTPYMAPDATALGQIFWYTVEGGGKNLEELRSIQDWYVRYQLNSVQGVAQVASVGGFVREYQIDVDPEKLRAFDLTLGRVFDAVMASNASVGGKVIHQGGGEYLVRATGWIRDLKDIEDIVVVERRGVPVTVGTLGRVQLGPAFRRSVLEKNGGEAVGGVVMMRFGENPLEVTERIKERIRALQPGLPEGVRVVPFYDRTGLIEAAIGTLRSTLLEEIFIASLVVLLILWHVRSAFVICVTLPLAVLISFILMHLLNIPSNIMSLSGIAISIGVLVDAGIVMTENAYHRLRDKFGDTPVTGDTKPVIIEACKVVGGPLFFSILIMLLSFAPIFALGGMEGKMFNPLAYTKSFALVGVAILGITLVPALLPTFIRGRLRSQDQVWLVKSVVDIYRPMLDFFMRHPDAIVVITGIFMLVSLHIMPPKVPWIFFVIGVPFMVGFTLVLVARHKIACAAILLVVAGAAWQVLHPLGEEFMPPLDELSIMDMPTSRPTINITQAADDIKARDAVLRRFPEVHQVVGKVGRADTPTDPAPIEMVETIVTLRPHDWWPKRKIKYVDVLAETRTLTDDLIRRGALSPIDDMTEFVNTSAMEPAARFDRAMRELSMKRLEEFRPERTRELVRRARRELLDFLRRKGELKSEPADTRWIAAEENFVAQYAPIFDEWILPEDVGRLIQALTDFLVAERAVEKKADLLVERETVWTQARDWARSIVGSKRPTLEEGVTVALNRENDGLMVDRIKKLNWELADRAPGELVDSLYEEVLNQARSRKLLVKEPGPDEARSIRADLASQFGRGLFLWKKMKNDIQREMDSELQVPGWGNIWTQPIVNRIDMLSTGVRTMIGVKVSGEDPEKIQLASDAIAEALKKVPGAVDVIADQIQGKYYLEINIDREKAKRYGVLVEDIENVVEVALGGKEITMTLEGRRRFPVRVRYPRDWRDDEEKVKNMLVPARGKSAATSSDSMGMSAAASDSRLAQVPLSLVADVKIAQGPSMIRSEDGRLRSYVQLNVRDRDIVGFVEEARAAVASKVKLPPGVSIDWSGEFEHQMRAQATLTKVVPVVILVIFVILFITYRDFPDTFIMFLSVPGAVAGGAIFQALWGYNFSVAVWVGYIACFGLATETGIVMLVYLREAIDRRGGLEAMHSEGEIKEAVMEGAVHRLRPKLLTEGTMILALIPMLWAKGVGAEFMRPMAVPILGGILVADEVIDILIPVLFYWDRCRRLRSRQVTETP